VVVTASRNRSERIFGKKGEYAGPTRKSGSNPQYGGKGGRPLKNDDRRGKTLRKDHTRGEIALLKAPLMDHSSSFVGGNESEGKRGGMPIRRGVLGALLTGGGKR